MIRHVSIFADEPERVAGVLAELMRGVAVPDALGAERRDRRRHLERVARHKSWHCFRCNRGPFRVIELWIENERMVEILPPEYARVYLVLPRSQGLNLAKSKFRPSKTSYPN